MISAARPLSSASRPSSSGSGLKSTVFSRPPSSSLSEPKKRKRELDAGLASAPAAPSELLEAPIVLKPHSSSLTVKPRVLHPLMLLPRDNLPLSSLDLAQPHGDFPVSRHFESRIKILDLEDRLGSNVLLARSETTRMIYALERDGPGLYILCKIGGWVEIEKLAKWATVVCDGRVRPHQPKPVAAGVLAHITPQMHKEEKRRKLAIEEIHQSIVRKRSSTVISRDDSSQLPTPPDHGPTPDKPEGQEVVSNNDSPGNSVATPSHQGNALVVSSQQQTPGEDSLAQPSAEAIFQSIRTQYSEALYHSMRSLAYFAKGPLSRARAAFHLDCDSNLDMNDLIAFLRSMVTNTTVIDRKYRETIPNILSTMKMHIDDSEEGESKPKKRKPKKTKLGKDGLYPSEDADIRRWWTANNPLSDSQDEDATISMKTKYLVSCLRRRETQLQMILILEILALEPLCRQPDANEDSQLPGMESQPTATRVTPDPGMKKKKKTDLPYLLDIHADRLCIWQSTTLDHVKSLAESQNPKTGSNAQTERADSDPLKDFCVDVIIPFFSARLPELCDSINRKLGGPTTQAPQKEKRPKPVLPRKSKPGAPVKRPSATNRSSERILQRALSQEQMRRSISREPSQQIARLLAATATTIPGLKREGSEPLLSMIPRGNTASLKDRPPNLFSRSTSSVMTQGTKAQKAAHVEAELRDAISALKKPNRTLAVKEFVDAAERRASGVNVPPKKLKKPSRVSGVQVIKATPAHNRFKDVLAAESQLDAVDEEAELILPSSVVPESNGPARRFSNLFASSKDGGTLNVPSLAFQIQATPIRKPVNSWPLIQDSAREEEDDPINLPSSPVMARKAAPSVPANARARLGNKPTSDSLRTNLGQTAAFPSSPCLAGLFETPIQTRLSKDNSNRMMIKGATINETPVKSTSLFARSARSTGVENENAAALTVNPITELSTTPQKGSRMILGETPLAKATKATTTTIVEAQQEKTRKTPDIFQRLGWDDDFDDLA
ncbi:DNA replication regulator SLD3-domain-containing protein [Rhypophila decipiens]|uniref:DNA replication regulator SLD3-domain-containing protein n=1 Tax=Rhypophila decipiens TaxID=261697 RepID=A0AAN6Y5D5_9PEZI|nr:DNA replication regulator SLD3-domain-containing protein [Rhypophila decipiens]